MTIKKIEAQSPWAQSSDLVAENIAKPQAPSPKPQVMFPELLTESGNRSTINVDVLKALVGDAKTIPKTPKERRLYIDTKLKESGN